jgi:hypothetical protein
MYRVHFTQNTVKVTIFGYKPRSNSTVPVPNICFSRTVPGRMLHHPSRSKGSTIHRFIAFENTSNEMHQGTMSEPAKNWMNNAWANGRTGRRVNEWNEMNRPEMNEGRKEWMSEMSGRRMSKWRGERMNELPCFEHLALKMLNLVSVVFFFLMFVSLFIPVFRYLLSHPSSPNVPCLRALVPTPPTHMSMCLRCPTFVYTEAGATARTKQGQQLQYVRGENPHFSCAMLCTLYWLYCTVPYIATETLWC